MSGGNSEHRPDPDRASIAVTRAANSRGLNGLTI